MSQKGLLLSNKNGAKCDSIQNKTALKHTSGHSNSLLKILEQRLIIITFSHVDGLSGLKGKPIIPRL